MRIICIRINRLNVGRMVILSALFLCERIR
nr:MAG TPA: hypothetical protein [Caudoviricetes sp.]DAP35484.1 MAG TPA: hypothetical protein [Caudoviricetes sp.]